MCVFSHFLACHQSQKLAVAGGSRCQHSHRFAESAAYADEGIVPPRPPLGSEFHSNSSCAGCTTPHTFCLVGKPPSTIWPSLRRALGFEPRLTSCPSCSSWSSRRVFERVPWAVFDAMSLSSRVAGTGGHFVVDLALCSSNSSRRAPPDNLPLIFETSLRFSPVLPA